MTRIEDTFIIDDDPIFVFGLKKMIANSELCKHIEVFKNGEEAIQHIKSLLSQPERLPDLIFLDINMPVMNGWGFLDEFVKIAKQIGKKIKIYILSSSIDAADISKAKTYIEVTDYLLKPIQGDALVSVFNS